MSHVLRAGAGLAAIGPAEARQPIRAEQRLLTAHGARSKVNYGDKKKVNYAIQEKVIDMLYII